MSSKPFCSVITSFVAIVYNPQLPMLVDDFWLKTNFGRAVLLRGTKLLSLASSHIGTMVPVVVDFLGGGTQGTFNYRVNPAPEGDPIRIQS